MIQIFTPNATTRFTRHFLLLMAAVLSFQVTQASAKGMLFAHDSRKLNVRENPVMDGRGDRAKKVVIVPDRGVPERDPGINSEINNRQIDPLSDEEPWISTFTGKPLNSAREKATNPPVITSMSPSSGAIGTVVTITGTDLGGLTAFTIGGVNAIVVSNSGTALVGMVMPGTVSGSASVTTAAGTGTGGAFTTTAPTVPTSQQG